MKLKTKLLLTVISVIVLLTVALSILFSLLMGASAKEQFNKRGFSVATSAASNGRLGVMMGDSTQLSSLMESAMIDKEVRSVIFFDKIGKRIAGRGEEFSSSGTMAGTDPVEEELKDNAGSPVAVFKAPVFVRQGDATVIGFTQVGISLANLRADIRNSILWSAVFCILFSLSGIVVVYLIMKLVQPLLSGIKLVSTGDLTIHLEQKTNDEIGQHIESLNDLVSGLRSTVSDVQEVTVAVSQQVNRITEDSAAMNNGMQRQMDQATQVTSSVEEMTRTIIANSKTASETAGTAQKAKEAAEQGGRVVEATVSGMKKIADVVNKTAETVKALGKSSDQIGEIIGVIDDIADQTNLLALNAAIEAARAGDQGRGFAVVADEVRKLAERTTKATKEISVMIKNIQTVTAGAVTSMQEGTNEVNNGIALADRAGTSLHEIVGMIQHLTDMVSQIAAASEQQSSAAEQIMSNVESISSVTSESANGTQQIARSAEDLNQLTENLQQLVSKFKLSDNAEAAASRPERFSMAAPPRAMIRR